MTSEAFFTTYFSFSFPSYDPRFLPVETSGGLAGPFTLCGKYRQPGSYSLEPVLSSTLVPALRRSLPYSGIPCCGVIESRMKVIRLQDSHKLGRIHDALTC